METEKLTPIQQELLSRADSIFKSVSETVNTGVELAKEQLPDIAYQYIAMERAYLSSIMVMAVVATVLISVWVYRFAFVNVHKFSGYDSELRWFGLVPWFAITLVSMMTFFNHLKPLFMVWFAPKIYLITTIVNLVK